MVEWLLWSESKNAPVQITGHLSEVESSMKSSPNDENSELSFLSSETSWSLHRSGMWTNISESQNPRCRHGTGLISSSRYLHSMLSRQNQSCRLSWLLSNTCDHASTVWVWSSLVSEVDPKNAKWQGETNTEIMKRHLKEKEFIILKKLESYGRTRALQRESRKRKWFVTVGIVGYTNAWKSSLFNTLTKKWVLAEDKLFATLGTSVWKVWINLHEENTDNSIYKAEWFELLINDTIGFIRDLPPELISAFTSTLEDSVESDLLLHVIDSNDEWIDEKISIVDATLESIEATQPRLYIFNKIDGLDTKKRKALEKKYRELSPVFVSAMTAEGIDVLKERLKDHFWR